MPVPPTPRTARDARPARAARADGVDARSRILLAALALFAEKGFAKTSTRAIAQAAQANIAAISYYFGDKAGLYAATFTEPMGGNMPDLIALFEARGLPIAEALRIFMTGYLEPLKDGDIARQCMRLHLRELLEPTGQWATELERDVRAPHEALVRVLCRHLQLARSDDDVQRLAFAITGLATQLFVMRDVVDVLQPRLLGSSQQIDTWTDRLVHYALSMVAAEARRRTSLPARSSSGRRHSAEKQVP
ncbi:MAG: DUF1956 domain-containing protein [Comamonadaceae bacterium]|nr:MAG: DUF1956 domain-containing protein [Comamonadaceae bacterium]